MAVSPSLFPSSVNCQFVQDSIVGREDIMQFLQVLGCWFWCGTMYWLLLCFGYLVYVPFFRFNLGFFRSSYVSIGVVVLGKMRGDDRFIPVVVRSSKFEIVRTNLRIHQLGDFLQHKSPKFPVMTFNVITPQKCILWEALQFNLEQVMSSTHFEFLSCETKLGLPLFKGPKSPKEVISWLLSSVESQEGFYVQGPWDFVASRHWELLGELRQSPFEDRFGFFFQQVSSHSRSVSSRLLTHILLSSFEISLSRSAYVIGCFYLTSRKFALIKTHTYSFLVG